MEKNEQMPMQFSAEDLGVMERLRNAFNPDGLLNPQKILPSPRGCKEVLTPKFPGVIEGARA
jgi:glycolate oxidase